MAPTAKHFPGLGAAAVNTDDAVQRIDSRGSRAAARRRVALRRFVGGGGAGRLVMVSSAVYPAFSERPAALTRALATEELRDRLGFRGVSITDALETASTAAFGGPTRAAKRAARAGTDLLLFTGADAASRAGRSLRGAAAPARLAAPVRRPRSRGCSICGLGSEAEDRAHQLRARGSM